MNRKIQWQKGLFSNTYKIFQDQHSLGTLDCKSLSYSAKANLSEGSYSFNSSGVASIRTQIIDLENQKVVGEITFGSLLNDAKIKINGVSFNLTADNIWQTRWTLTNTKKEPVFQYNNSTTSGQVISTSNQYLLLLSGLYCMELVKKVTYLILFICLGSMFITLFVTLGSIFLEASR